VAARLAETKFGLPGAIVASIVDREDVIEGTVVRVDESAIEMSLATLPDLCAQLLRVHHPDWCEIHLEDYRNYILSLSAAGLAVPIDSDAITQLIRALECSGLASRSRSDRGWVTLHPHVSGVLRRGHSEDCSEADRRLIDLTFADVQLSAAKALTERSSSSGPIRRLIQHATNFTTALDILLAADSRDGDIPRMPMLIECTMRGLLARYGAAEASRRLNVLYKRVLDRPDKTYLHSAYEVQLVDALLEMLLAAGKYAEAESIGRQALQSLDELDELILRLDEKQILALDEARKDLGFFRWHAWRAICLAGHMHGRDADAIKAALQALTAAESTGKSRVRAQAECLLAQSYTSGDRDHAREHASNGLAMAEVSADPDGRMRSTTAVCHKVLAAASMGESGLSAAGEDHMRRAFVAIEGLSAGPAEDMAVVADLKAELYLIEARSEGLRGNLLRASQFGRRALRHYATTGSIAKQVDCFEVLTQVAALGGREHEAARYSARAEELVSEVTGTATAVRLLTNEGDAARQREDWESAYRSYGQASRQAVGARDRYWAHLEAGTAAMHLRDWERAADHYETALQMCGLVDDIAARGRCLHQFGRLEEEQGRYAMAGDFYQQALDALTHPSAAGMRVASLHHLAMVETRALHLDKAAAHAAAAIRTNIAAGDSLENLFLDSVLLALIANQLGEEWTRDGAKLVQRMEALSRESPGAIRESEMLKTATLLKRSDLPEAEQFSIASRCLTLPMGETRGLLDQLEQTLMMYESMLLTPA
jgi:tetratricopeptide (TPR) repeat protein